MVNGTIDHLKNVLVGQCCQSCRVGFIKSFEPELDEFGRL